MLGYKYNNLLRDSYNTTQTSILGVADWMRGQSSDSDKKAVTSEP